MAENEIPGDEDHTMGELYDHRHALWFALASSDPVRGAAWKSRNHHVGGEPMFPGYFIVGATLPGAGQVSYHLPNSRWNDCPGAERANAPEWDGHTSEQVVQRLYLFAVEQAAQAAREASARGALQVLKDLTWDDLDQVDQVELVKYTLAAQLYPARRGEVYPSPAVRADIRALPRQSALSVADQILQAQAGTADRPTPDQLRESMAEAQWTLLLQALGTSCISYGEAFSDYAPGVIHPTWGDLDDADKAALVTYSDAVDALGKGQARKVKPMVWSRSDLQALNPLQACYLAEQVLGLIVGKNPKELGAGDVTDALGSAEVGRLRKITADKIPGTPALPAEGETRR